MRHLLIIALILLGGMTNTLAAQDITPGTAGPGAVFNDTIMLRLSRRLQLTPTQQPQVAAIMNSYRADLAANPPGSPEERRTRKRNARSQVMALLTPEQKARLKANRNGKGSGGKRGWIDVLLDDVARPMLDGRRRQRGGE